MVLPAPEAFQTESKAKATTCIDQKIKRILLQKNQKKEMWSKEADIFIRIGNQFD